MRKSRANYSPLLVLLLILSLLCGCQAEVATPLVLPSQPAVTVVTATDEIEPINNTDLYSYEGKEPKTLYEYYVENEDTIGWLTIAGIDTDNIVMLGQKYKEYEKGSMGKNHYLNYDFYHNPRTAGELYIDHRGAIGHNTFSQNVTLYGHHMQNGTMLAGLERYRNRAHLEEYPYFTFRSLWNTYHFKIFAVFVVDQKNPVDFAFDFRQPEYENEQAFLDLVDQIKERSMYDIDVEVGGSDRVMNLITCTYPTGNPDTDDARLVVFGRLCTDQAEIEEAEALLKTKS